MASLTGMGWTYAYWNSQGSIAVGSIKNGELALDEPVQTWELRSGGGGVLAASASVSSTDPAMNLGDLKNLTTPCGQGMVLEVSDTYQVRSAGDNLGAKFKLTWPGATAAGAFAVLDQDGRVLLEGTISDSDVMGALPTDATALTVKQSYGTLACDDPYSKDFAGGDDSNVYGHHRLELVQP
ncbi:MAG: hypothetical protein LBD97_03400 [Bifidobacteriaceae bacterium]|nr:hypothetical protein [Bifidobacteriaceae bacterium]